MNGFRNKAIFVAVLGGDSGIVFTERLTPAGMLQRWMYPTSDMDVDDMIPAEVPTVWETW